MQRGGPLGNLGGWGGGGLGKGGEGLDLAVGKGKVGV